MLENPLLLLNHLSPPIKENLVVGLLLLFVAGVFKLIERNYRSWLKMGLRILRKLNIEVFPHQQVLTFSIKHNDDFNSGLYYEEIKKRFLKNLEYYGLANVLTHKDFSDIVLFRNSEEAELFRNDKDLSLILWGEFLNEHLKRAGDIESEFLLFFTYEFNHNIDNELEIRVDFDKRIRQFLAVKNKWVIAEKESLQDVADVSDGMFTVAVFTIGLSFLNRGDIEQSTLVFNQLHEYLTSRADNAAILLKPYVRQCSVMLVNKAIKEKRTDWKSVALLAQKIVEITPQDLESLVLLAYSLYKSGDVEKSLSTVTNLMNLYPNAAAARVNLAFFQVLEGKYENAVKHYKRVFNVSNPGFATVEIIDFLATEYEKTKEAAFLFASAGISYYHNGDLVLAKQDMEKFLLKGTYSKYGNMFLEGKKILILIKKALLHQAAV